MTLKFPMVVLALLPLALPAGVLAKPRQADPPVVSAFYRDPEHCAYMAGLPENDSPEFLKRFETDVKAAVEALQVRNSSLNLTNALFHLKAGCDRALARVR